MEVLCLTGCPRTYGEVYSLVRRRRDERAVKCLRPFGLQNKMAAGYPLSFGGDQASRRMGDNRSSQSHPAVRGAASSCGGAVSSPQQTVLWTEVLVLKYLYHSAAIGRGGEEKIVSSSSSPSSFPFSVSSSVVDPTSANCDVPPLLTSTASCKESLVRNGAVEDVCAFRPRQREHVECKENCTNNGCGGTPQNPFFRSLSFLYGPSSVCDTPSLHPYFYCHCSQCPCRGRLSPSLHSHSDNCKTSLLASRQEKQCPSGSAEQFFLHYRPQKDPVTEGIDSVINTVTPVNGTSITPKNVNVLTNNDTGTNGCCYYKLLQDWHAHLLDSLHVSALSSTCSVSVAETNKPVGRSKKAVKKERSASSDNSFTTSLSFSSVPVAVHAVLSLYESHGRAAEAQWAREIRKLVQSLAYYAWCKHQSSGSLVSASENSARKVVEENSTSGVVKKEAEDDLVYCSHGSDASPKSSHASTSDTICSVNSRASRMSNESLRSDRRLPKKTSSSSSSSFYCRAFPTLLPYPTPLREAARESFEVSDAGDPSFPPYSMSSSRRKSGGRSAAMVVLGNESTSQDNSHLDRERLFYSSFFCAQSGENCDSSRTTSIASSAVGASSCPFFILSDLEVLEIVNSRPQRIMDVYRVLEDIATRWDTWATIAGLHETTNDDIEEDADGIPRDADSFVERIVQVFKV